MFGVDVKVEQFQYDMDAVQKKYGMRNKPTTHHVAGEFTVFQNKKETVRVHEDRVARFIVNTTVEKSVVYHKSLGHWIDGGRLLDFLAEELIKQHRPPLVFDSIILLSDKQISKIADMTNTQDLKKYCMNEDVAIFIHTTQA
jgi:hypothetical protein